MNINTKNNLYTNRQEIEYEEPQYEKKNANTLCNILSNIIKFIALAIEECSSGLIKIIITAVIIVAIIIISFIGVSNIIQSDIPNLTDKQIEDLKSKINSVNKISKNYVITYSNNEAKKCDWMYAISMLLAKSGNNLDNINKTTSSETAVYTGTYTDAIKASHDNNQLPFDVYLIYGIIKQESDWNHGSISSAGCYGLMQTKPDNFFYYMGQGADITDPILQIEAGCRLLKDYWNNTHDITLMLAAYNAGIGNVKKYGGIPPFKETQNYVIKVQQWAEQYRKGFLSIPNSVITGSTITGNCNYVEQVFNSFINNRVIQDFDTACKNYQLTDEETELAKTFLEYKDCFKDYFGNEYDFNFKFSVGESTEVGTIVTGGSNLQMAVVTSAKKLLNLPYVYGGNYAPLGFSNGTDCSGLCQWAYNDNGIYIGRTTHDQIKEGIEVYENDLQPGDLIFTRGKSDNGHVFMYIGENQLGQHVCIEAQKTGTLIHIRTFKWDYNLYRARRIIISN